MNTHSRTRAFDHVLVIMFENQYREYVMANSYFRGLARRGIDLTAFFGVMHPSQTNYIASIAGELCNVTSDEQPPPLPQRTVVDLIEESPEGLHWKAYMDSYIPQNTPWSPELQPRDEYPYVIKHNPFSSFAGILSNEARWSRIVGESELFADLLNGRLPEYAWFTPNMWNDGHYTDGTQTEPAERAPALVDQAAVWLEEFFGKLRFPGPHSHLPPRTLVVVTFDESDFLADWDAGAKYTYDGPNQIYTVLLGDTVRPGVEEEGYNHYSLLHTIEKNFGLGTLGKNDEGANWFQFLWNRRFGWSPPEPTPIVSSGALACAELGGLVFAVYADEAGLLQMRSLKDSAWNDAQPVGLPASPAVAMASCADRLFLMTLSPAGRPAVYTYSLLSGWSPEPVLKVSSRATALAITAIKGGTELMAAYVEEDGAIVSRRWANGVWGKQTRTGHSTDGPIALSCLGACVLLVFKTPGQSTLSAISYNTAKFNVVTIAESEYGGSYDNTTVDHWSPSAFPVAKFGAAPCPVTPGEKEPVTDTFSAGGPLTMGTLDGVLHLIHTGPANQLLLTETFSVAGVMTAKLPVSYNQSDEKTTSNGYGTLAEAGWSVQRPVNGASLAIDGQVVCTRSNDELLLLIHSCPSGAVSLCRGRYEFSQPTLR